jgi:hypothetical protein
MGIALHGQNPGRRAVQQNLLPARQRQYSPVTARRDYDDGRRARLSER